MQAFIHTFAPAPPKKKFVPLANNSSRKPQFHITCSHCSVYMIVIWKELQGIKKLALVGSTLIEFNILIFLILRLQSYTHLSDKPY